LQGKIAEDIIHLLNQPNSGQIIVYIQDKQRLQELITYLQEQLPKFNLNKDYLEIHANISDLEKENINRFSNQVKLRSCTCFLNLWFGGRSGTVIF
jgi:hypothetical protein